MRSILDRYERLEHAADELAGSPLIGAPSPVALATVSVLTELMDLGQRFSSGSTPPAMRAMMLMLNQSRPMMLEGIGKIPPADIRRFMSELRDKLDVIINAPDDEHLADEPAPAANEA